MEKAKTKKKKAIIIIPILIVLLVSAFFILRIKVPFQDIQPIEIELYGPPLQFFGIEYEYLDHDMDESIPEGVARISVPLKDYFKAEEAISRSHALMGIIDDCLYSFADNVGLNHKVIFDYLFKSSYMPV